MASLEHPTCSHSHTLRLGARGSLLSRIQSTHVAQLLEIAHPSLKIEWVLVQTSGDRIQDRPLHDIGGKGLFTKELEQSLLRRDIDIAVHSFKDVPVTMPLVDQAEHELIIAATPAREDARDVLVAAKRTSVANLPREAIVGTGSLRRRCQLLAVRPDLRVTGVRGNVDTRLRKCRVGEFDAIVLAMAGVKRAALFDESTMQAIDHTEMLPSAGQGALAIQCRRDDRGTRELLQSLDDPNTALCVKLERDVVLALNGDCHSPIAAWARIDGSELALDAAVGLRGGQPPVIRAHAHDAVSNAHATLQKVILQLKNAGALQMLHS